MVKLNTLLCIHCTRFQFFENEDGTASLSSQFVKSNNMLKKAANREYVTVEFEYFTRVNRDSMLKASRPKRNSRLN